jgi:F-type H+-transporting ATPase subunit delta
MSEQSVAFRYAKSLIGLAQEKNVLDTVYQDMQFFSRTCRENRSLILALQSPVVKHHKKLDILTALFKGRVSEVTFSIFEIMTRKNREALLPAVAEAFNEQYRELNNIQTAHVTTVTPLTAAQRTQFEQQIASATGKAVELREKIDPSLIGGYLLRVGDRQVDASIKHRLNELKVRFTQ